MTEVLGSYFSCGLPCLMNKGRLFAYLIYIRTDGSSRGLIGGMTQLPDILEDVLFRCYSLTSLRVNHP